MNILSFLFLISTLFFVRLLLIITGLIKEPVLRRFEKYGDEELFYYPLPHLLFWSGTFVLLGSLWASSLIGVWFPGDILGVILLIGAVIAEMLSDYVRRHPTELLMYPRWLYNLQRRTTRLERRRMAYMWLRLPWKTRLIYNSSDRAFLQWADFIIISTLM